MGNEDILKAPISRLLGRRSTSNNELELDISSIFKDFRLQLPVYSFVETVLDGMGLAFEYELVLGMFSHSGCWRCTVLVLNEVKSIRDNRSIALQSWEAYRTWFDDVSFLSES